METKSLINPCRPGESVLGMVGLGVMGRNLVLNMADHGFAVAGYDRDPAQVALLAKDAGKRNIHSTGSLADPADLQMRLNFDSAPGMGVALSWGLPTAILQSANSVEGPYVDVPSAPSPYYVASKTGMRFYRYRFVGTNWVSNPYQM